MQRWTIKEIDIAREAYEEHGIERAAMAVKRSVSSIKALRARGWRVSTSERKKGPTVQTLALTMAEEGGLTTRDLHEASHASMAYCFKVIHQLVGMGILVNKGAKNNGLYFLSR